MSPTNHFFIGTIIVISSIIIISSSSIISIIIIFWLKARHEVFRQFGVATCGLKAQQLWLSKLEMFVTITET